MKMRPLEAAIVLIGIAAIVWVAIASGTAGIASVPSTYDTGPRGYEALYNVLQREEVPVARLRAPLGRLPKTARVLVTAISPQAGSLAAVYGAQDLKRIERFVRGGGTVVAFLPPKSTLPKAFAHLPKTRVHRFDVTQYDNAALDAHPGRARDAYATIAERGVAYFDEYPYGYDDTRSLWSVLPEPVRAAFWVTVALLVLLLIDANVPFVPPMPLDPPQDRDSAAYITSMAALLRRARAGRAAIARFAHTYPNDSDLQRLASLAQPSDAVLLHAAKLTASRRKDPV